MMIRQAVVLKAVVTIISVMAINHSSFAEDAGTPVCAKSSEMEDLASGAKTAAAPLKSESGGSSIDGLITAWGEARTKCKDRNYDAQGECFEACSKSAQDGLTSANVLSGLMAAMSAMNATCGAANQAQNNMQNGYKDFTAKCTAAQKSCKTECGTAVTKAEELVKAANAVQCTNEQTKAACEAAKKALVAKVEEDKGPDKKFVAGKKTQCDATFTSALSGAGNVISGLAGVLGKLAQKCGKDSDASNDPGTNAADTASTIPCASLPAGSSELSSKRCVCELSNGTNPVCSNSTLTSASNFAPTTSDTGSTDVTDDSGTGTGTGTGSGSQAGNTGSGSGGSGGSSGMGGGGLLGAAATSGKTGDKADAAAAKAKTDANILAGESSGGSGGGNSGWGSYGSEADKKAGAAAAARAVASKAGIAAFTSKYGVTNWEKVNERYKDSRPTFLKEY